MSPRGPIKNSFAADIAVVFDMDGVIVNSEVYWRQVESDFLGKLVPGWGRDEQQSILGMSIDDVHRKLVTEFGVQLSRQEYLESYQELAFEIYRVRSQAFPGVIKLIKELEYPVGICSSSPRAWILHVVERFELKDFVDATVSADDVGGRGKPAPDVYLLAQQKLQSRVTVAIEDTSKGIQSAKAAGLLCFGFRNGINAQADFSQADGEFDDFAAFPRMFADLLGSVT